MKRYCSAIEPPCFVRFTDDDEPESVTCDRARCPTRMLLTVWRASERSTVSIPSLRREAAARSGAQR